MSAPRSERPAVPLLVKSVLRELAGPLLLWIAFLFLLLFVMQFLRGTDVLLGSAVTLGDYGRLAANLAPHFLVMDIPVGLFVAGLRGHGLGREVTRLVLSWAFEVLGVHRVELEVAAGNNRAINCYLACGFRQEGVRREAEPYPEGWKDFILMGLLQSEYQSRMEN